MSQGWERGVVRQAGGVPGLSEMPGGCLVAVEGSLWSRRFMWGSLRGGSRRINISSISKVCSSDLQRIIGTKNKVASDPAADP